MKRFIDVHTGEIMAASEDSILKSETDKKCLVLIAYDSLKKIGGIAHAMFSSNVLKDNSKSSILCDAGKAIDELIDNMSLLGARKDDIKIKLVAGENVPHKKDDTNYNENVKSTVDLLKKRHINIEEDTTTDIGDSHVILDVGTGKISYS